MNYFIKNLIILFLAVFIGFNSVNAQSFNQDLLNLLNHSRNTDPDIIKAYQKIFIPEAWNFINSRTPPLSEVKIGIIDSGVDQKHPEFSSSTIVNFGSSTPNDLTDSGVSVLGTLTSHGTNVAGIIGANNISATSGTNYVFPHMNGIVSGVKGLNYSLESRKVREGPFTLLKARRKIQELTRAGVPIINLSGGAFAIIGNFIFDFTIQRSQNTLFIVAAGNDDKNAAFVSPANLGGSLGNVITIGATDLEDRRLKSIESSSNFGSEVNIAAPGSNVYSPSFFTRPILNLLDYEKTFSDTSASAPLVTGVAAILKSLRPTSTPAEIKNILTRSADPLFAPIGSDEAGKSLGSGCSGSPSVGQVVRGCRLNALRAIQTALKSQILIYFGNGGANPEQFGSGAATFTTIKNRYQSVGSLVSYTDIFPSNLDGFLLAIIVLPGADNDSEINFFTPSQVNALKTFLNEGGRLVILGNHSGLFGIRTLNNLLERLGVNIRQNADAVTRDFDRDPPLTDITSVPVTAGVHSLDFSAASSLTLGPKALSIVRIQPGLPNTGATVVALQKIGNGEVIVIGDSQGFDDFAFSDPFGDGFGDAFRFADNLAETP